MISYQEIVKYYKDFRYDSDTQKVYSKADGKEVEDKDLANKIKTAYFLVKLGMSKEDIRRIPDREERNQELRKYIEKVHKKISLNILEGSGKGKVDYDYFGRGEYEQMLKTPDLIQAYAHSILQEHHMDCNGVEVEQVPMDKRIDSLSGNVLTLQGMHSTSSPMRTEQHRRKHKFVKDILATYDQVERKEDYQKRATLEEEQACIVVNAIKNGKIDLTQIQGMDFIQLLKAAENITLKTGRDYLREFSNIPEVNKKLLTYRDNQAVDVIKKTYPQRTEKYPLTKMEQEKKFVDEELAHNGNLTTLIVSSKITAERLLESGKSLAGAPPSTIMAARQLGYEPSRIRGTKKKDVEKSEKVPAQQKEKQVDAGKTEDRKNKEITLGGLLKRREAILEEIDELYQDYKEFCKQNNGQEQG